MSPGLTCRSQHGAGEEQGGHEVPVVIGVVTQHGHSIVVGLERAGQELLQARVRHAGVVSQELLSGRNQLLPKLLFERKFDGGEDPGADDKVTDVTSAQKRKIQRRVVSLHKLSAPACGTDERHVSSFRKSTRLSRKSTLDRFRVTGQDGPPVYCTAEPTGLRLAFLIPNSSAVSGDVALPLRQVSACAPECVCVVVPAFLPLQPVSQVPCSQ